MNADALTIPDDVLVAELAGEAVLLHSGTKRYYRLNETGAWIWKGLEEGLRGGTLVDHVVSRFEVSRDAATSEIEALVADLREHELVVPDDGSEDAG